MQNPSISIKNLIALCVLLVAGSCTKADEAQKEFEQQAFRLSENITETNSAGEVTSTDPDDWRVSPLYSSFVEVSPAYPNPTNGESIKVELLVTGLGSVNGLEIYFFDETDRLRLLNFDERIPLPVGFTEYEVNPLQFSSGNTIAGAIGLHRVLIYDRRGDIISYGDIKIE